jgi:hypothetical protein
MRKTNACQYIEIASVPSTPVIYYNAAIMEAYFTASVVGKQYHFDKYKKIVEMLERKGVKVKYEHIFNASEATIRMKTKEERLAFEKQLENSITAADFMVVESTFPSISVGYEISLALNRGKPVLILYNSGDPPSLFAYHSDEKLVCEKYSPDTLETIIDDFLNFVSGSSDMRFTFFITSKIAAYLDTVSKKRKVPKSVYLRYLIEQAMKERT